jgi:hypothetical protein
VNEKSWPVTVVMAERCGVCAGDREDQHPGHSFVPGPIPLPVPESEVRLAKELKTSIHRGGQDQLEVAATHSSGATVTVWAWRNPAATVARQHGYTGVGADEWVAVVEAAGVALGRVLCPHVDLQAYAGVARLTEREPSAREPLPPAIGYQGDIRVWCVDCGEPMVFVGDLPLGMSPAHPSTSYDRCTLSAPLRPASMDERWGQNRPGVSIRRVQ